MRLDELRDLLRKVTYKPGARIDFVFVDHDPARPAFVLELAVQSVTTLAPTRVCNRHEFTHAKLARMDEAEVLALIYQKLVLLETHEVREWFQHEHVPVVDPHPEIRHLTIKIHGTWRERFGKLFKRLAGAGNNNQ